MQSRGSFLFFILLLLAGAAAAILIAENRMQQGHAEPFQHLVGGLGFGPALDLSGCASAFDPRLDASCHQEYGPIPGGACFGPQH
jgi:hypothetical protein